MRRSNRSLESESRCLCCFLPVLATMGLSLYGIVYANIVQLKLADRIDRLKENYNNAVNVTMSYSSTCDGNLQHFEDRGDCPTYDPCDDYCQKYFDANGKFLASFFGSFFLIVVFSCVITALFAPQGLNLIENIRNFINNCRAAPNRPDTYTSLNDDVESLRFVGDGSVNTSLNSTRRFLTDQSRFHESQNASQPPYNKDGQCPITQEDIKDLNNPVVARDRYIYESKEISRWLVTHDTSPMTNLPMGKTLIPYNPNQASTDNQQQIVSAPCTLNRTLSLVVHTGSGDENEGKENTFMI